MSSLFYRGKHVYIKYKDRPGHWAVVPLGIKVDKTEKKNGKWVFPQEARNVQRKIDEDVALGIFGFRREIMNSTPKLSEVSEEYYARQMLKGSTVLSYKTSISHFISILGDLPIVQYREIDVERLRKRLLVDKKSEQTVAKTLR